MQLTVENLNGVTVDTDVINYVEDPAEKWDQIMDLKFWSYTDSFQQQTNVMRNDSKSVISETQLLAEQKIDNLVDDVKNKVETQLAIEATCPKDVADAFTNLFVSDIYNEMKDNPNAYKKVKTATQLVNTIAEKIAPEKGKLTFIVNGLECRAEYNVQNYDSVASLEIGYIYDAYGRRYMYGGTKINAQNIEVEMKNLKEFAEQKIDEAEEAMKSAVSDILLPDEIKKWAKGTAKKSVFKLIAKESPKLSNNIEKLYEMCIKYKALSDAFGGLKSLDMTNASEDQIVKKVTDYNKKLDSWNKAVDGFMP